LLPTARTAGVSAWWRPTGGRCAAGSPRAGPRRLTLCLGLGRGEAGILTEPIAVPDLDGRAGNWLAGNRPLDGQIEL
jgi:hypothetical protein